MRCDAMARMSSEEILAELRTDDDRHLVRPIGIWSLEKLATLFLYFRAFSKACQSVGGGHYVTTQRAIVPHMSDRLDLTFGSHAWAAIHRARLDGQITPREAQFHYLEEYCSSLRNLGYGWVRWKAITAPRAPGLRRQEMYHLIFATDHEAGDKIMEDVFRRPYVLDFPVSAQHSLFE